MRTVILSKKRVVLPSQGCLPDTVHIHEQVIRARARFLIAGFSLVEALVVLAVTSALLMVAVPSLVGMLGSTGLRYASNDFFVALQLARSEAIKRNSRVVACKSSDGSSCSVAGGWEQGWIVFHDANNDALHQSEEHLIGRYKSSVDGYYMYGNGNVRNYISFTATGNTRLTSHAFQAGTITACLPEHPEVAVRLIIINSTGRIRMEQKTGIACPASTGSPHPLAS